MNKIQGCLIGGAIGDSMGYPVEFLTLHQIIGQYGDDGITDLPFIVSDDTQMSLFTTEALIRSSQNGTKILDELRRAYQRWYITQTKPFTGGEGLLNIPELYFNRNAGLTCLTSLAEGHSNNDSKGNGGVMRVAPIGLAYSNPETAFKIGALSAKITHGHPSGYLPAGALAFIISQIVHHSIPIKEASLNALIELKKYKYHQETTDSIELALSLVSDATPIEGVLHIGGGWTGEEALAIGLFCSMKYENDFRKAISVAVNHGGDSDSTGAITGNILGAKLGLEGIPSEWVQRVELSELILEMATKIVVS